MVRCQGDQRGVHDGLRAKSETTKLAVSGEILHGGKHAGNDDAFVPLVEGVFEVLLFHLQNSMGERPNLDCGIRWRWCINVMTFLKAPS